MNRITTPNSLASQLIVSGWTQAPDDKYKLSYGEWYVRVLPTYKYALISKDKSMVHKRSYLIDENTLERILKLTKLID